MTVIKDLISIFDVDGSNERAVFDAIEKYPELFEFVSNDAEKATEVILSRVSEEDLVKLMRVISGMTLAIMLTEGCGFALLSELKQGSLDGFVHSTTLAIIGVLMDNDVI